jgi:glycosyltransferase involved in cell wall biosynthesis
MRPVRVSQVMMNLRPYRVPFLDRIARREDVAMTVYAGRGATGTGVPVDIPAVAVPVREVRNRTWPGQPLKVWWQSGALRVLRDESEVIVVQEVVSNLTVWAIRLLHRRFGKALVVAGFFYRPDGGGRFASVRARLRRFLRSSADSLVAYTERGRSELLAEGVTSAKVFVTTNTLDTSRLMSLAAQVTPEEMDSIRASLGIPPEAVVLCFLGRLRPIKRVDVAVEALKRLAVTGDRPYHLIVIGGGVEAEAIRELAGDSDVHLIEPTYDEAEIARYMSVCSLLVMPGSVGLAVVHGFANDLPCVTTDEAATTQTPEYAYVEDGVNGVIVSAPDPDRFAAAIREIKEKPAFLAQLRVGARATAERLDMDNMAGAFVEAVRAAAGSGSS